MILLSMLLALPAFVVAVPAITDIWAGLRPGRGRRPPIPPPGTREGLLFIVPAHDEGMLIRRCIGSLLAQDYPPDRLRVLVVADNCSDDTAAQAREAGAEVLERHSEAERGKGYAIGWALDNVGLDGVAAVVIIDADTIVEPDYATQLSRWAPLRDAAVQSYDGMSNEFENWLTRMAGVLTRNRYGIALPLKVKAGLSVPLTGDGTVLGTGLLARFPWRVSTITEGWELYAKYTLAGLVVHYEPDARLYAQETRSLAQSRSQRERWTAGRLSVFRLYWKAIVTTPGIRLLQRLDLVAELTNLGPVMRAAAGIAGALAVELLGLPGRHLLAALFLTGFLQPAAYSAVSVARHPHPWPTVQAFLRLPFYAVWRVLIGLRTFILSGTGRWVRTSRHKEQKT